MQKYNFFRHRVILQITNVLIDRIPSEHYIPNYMSQEITQNPCVWTCWSDSVNCALDSWVTHLRQKTSTVA
jgi:hypothetical protein